MSEHKIPMLREIIEERKVKAVDILSAGYAKNRLPLEEYERLVEYINKIESERELAVVEKIVSEYAVEEVKTEAPASEYDDDGDSDDSPSDYYHSHTHHSHAHHDSDYPGYMINPVIFSSRTHTGPVKSGAQFISLFGSQRLIIKKENLAKKQTRLEVVSIMGETTILVEPGIKVSNRVIPILGSSSTNQKVRKSAESGGRELVISGAALLGSIAIKVLKDNDE